jgi:hypothetical protein
LGWGCLVAKQADEDNEKALDFLTSALTSFHSNDILKIIE